MRTFTITLIILLSKVWAESEYTCYPKNNIHIYYVNGINTDKESYKENWSALKIVNDEYKNTNPPYNNFILYSDENGYFNQTEGIEKDLLEALLQKIDLFFDLPFEGSIEDERKVAEDTRFDPGTLPLRKVNEKAPGYKVAGHPDLKEEMLNKVYFNN
ncbi:hypothetical protein ACRXCV_14235 [Halobacteriovorax sp. GFR7]|uniref:hypothetical protein n=1 Tax=unclassified Halobacteriovorax TaxID=2639665 RepID=UPI003D96A5E3